MTAIEKLKALSDGEGSNLLTLLANIQESCQAIAKTVKEIENATFSADFETIDVPDYVAADMGTLRALVANYNARLLWRNTVRKIIDNLQLKGTDNAC